MSGPSEIAGMSEQWQKDQFKPLSMIDLGKQWIDAIKVAGSGNGAGLLAAGAALNTFAQKPLVVILLKSSAGSFLVGIFGFALAFLCIHIALFAHDEMAHATLRGDLAEIAQQARRSSRFMMITNVLAAITTLAFFGGCSIAAIVLVIV